MSVLLIMAVLGPTILPGTQQVLNRNWVKIMNWPKHLSSVRLLERSRKGSALGTSWRPLALRTKLQTHVCGTTPVTWLKAR